MWKGSKIHERHTLTGSPCRLHLRPFKSPPFLFLFLFIFHQHLPLSHLPTFYSETLDQTSRHLLPIRHSYSCWLTAIALCFLHFVRSSFYQANSIPVTSLSFHCHHYLLKLTIPVLKMKFGIFIILALLLTISSLTAVFSAPANEIIHVGDDKTTSVDVVDRRGEDMAQALIMRCEAGREWNGQCNAPVRMNTTLCLQLCDCNKLPAEWPCLSYLTCDSVTVTRECWYQADWVCCEAGLKRDTNTNPVDGPPVEVCKSLIPSVTPTPTH